MTDLLQLAGSSVERAPWGWALLLTVILALIKVWPIIQLQTDAARAQMRGEHKDALHDCTERLDAMDARLNAQTAHIHQLDMKLFGTVQAYRILHDGLQELEPANAALRQGRTMFQTTWDGPVDQLEGLA